MTVFISHSEKGETLCGPVTDTMHSIQLRAHHSVRWHTRKGAVIIWPTANDGTFGNEQIGKLHRDTHVVQRKCLMVHERDNAQCSKTFQSKYETRIWFFMCGFHHLIILPPYVFIVIS